MVPGLPSKLHSSNSGSAACPVSSDPSGMGRRKASSGRSSLRCRCFKNLSDPEDNLTRKQDAGLRVSCPAADDHPAHLTEALRPCLRCGWAEVIAQMGDPAGRFPLNVSKVQTEQLTPHMTYVQTRSNHSNLVFKGSRIISYLPAHSNSMMYT